DDGLLDKNEWPLEHTGRVPLTGYYSDKKTGEKRAANRGSACLMLDGDNLRGLIVVPRMSSKEGNVFHMTLIPIDPKTALPKMESKMGLVIEEQKDGVKGVIAARASEADGAASQPVGFSVSKSPKTVKSSQAPWYEFSIPLAKLRHFNTKKGATYAFNVTAVQAGGSADDAYAAWHRQDLEHPEQWGQLMVVE
ncbi:unnamed protein product, partial [marine sediment metagenome]